MNEKPHAASINPDEHWVIVPCEDQTRIHIIPLHAEEDFPLCWNKIAANAMAKAIRNHLKIIGFISQRD